MSATLQQIFTLNPATTILDTDLLYLVQSPYTPGTDAGITGASLKSLFVLSTAVVNVAHGGTGKTSFTPYSVITAGTTSTGPFQNVAGLGALGQVLTSQGPAALPQWTNPASSGTVTSISAGTGITLTPNPIVATGSVALTVPVTEILGGTNQTTYILGDMLYSSAANTLSKLAGNITAVKQYLSQTGTGAVSAAPAWATISGGDITGAALTKTDDTNVTLTLGGTPTTALLRATSLTLGWTGTLSVPRGGTDNSTFTAFSVICAGTTATGAFQNVVGLGNLNQVLTSQGAGALPAWQNNAASSVTFTGDSGTPFSGNAVTVTGGLTGLTFVAATPNLTLGGILKLANGGTNANLTASNGGIFYSTATAGAILSGTATANQILMSGASTTPAWSTATYPASTTVSQILYSSSANVIGGITTANDGVLVTSNTGVPSFLANSGTPGFVLTANTAAPPSWQAISGSSTVVIADDTTTNATMYPTWVTANTGSLPLKVSSTKLSFNPSTAALTLTGSITGLTGKIDAPTAIASSTGLNVLAFSYTASAVNYLTIQNSATNSPLNILASGTDTNLSIQIATKGGNLNIIDGSGTIAPILKLFNAAQTHGTGLQVATAQATDVTFTLPAVDGSNGSLLKTNGSGVLSFTTATFPSTGGAAGNILISDGTNYIASTSLWPNTVGTSGKVVISNGTSNVYSTPTFPNASATSGKIIISDGTNWIASTVTYPAATGWSTFTPTVTLVGGAGNTVPTYATNIGRYSQIGNVVFVNIYLNNTSGGTAGAGTGIINIALPVTSGAGITAGQVAGNGTLLVSTTFDLAVALVGPSATTVTLAYQSAIGTQTTAQGASQNNAVRQISLSFCYEI